MQGTCIYSLVRGNGAEVRRGGGGVRDYCSVRCFVESPCTIVRPEMDLPSQYLLWDRVERSERREDDLQLGEFRKRDSRIRSRIVNQNSGRLV